MQPTKIDMIRNLRNIPRIRMTHFIRRNYLDEVEKAIREQREIGAISVANVGGLTSIYQNPLTGTTLFIKIFDDVYARRHNYRFRYAFISREGTVLPDPEYSGEIDGPTQSVTQCLEKLVEGFEPITILGIRR